MKVFSKINWIIMKLFWFVSIVLFVGMLVIMSVQVFGRIFGFGLSWSEEFGRYGQVVIVNLGAALVMYDGTHINMNVLEELLKGVSKKVVKFIQYLAMVVYGVIVLYLSGPSLELAMKSNSAGMGIPMEIVYFVYPLMGAAIIIHSVYLICELLTAKSNTEAVVENGEVDAQ